MGLLDQVIGGLMGGQGGVQSSALQSVLGSLLGGGAANGGMGSVLGSLLGGGSTQQQQPTPGGMGGGSGSGMGGGLGGALAGIGGLGGLLTQFKNAGFGDIAESWIGSGANHPVTPDQLQQVLGHDRVQDMATQANMAPNDMLSQLSHLLPPAVDKLTPEGASPFDGAGQKL